MHLFRDNYLTRLIRGRKYDKIVFGGFTYCFIDRETGNLLEKNKQDRPTKKIFGNVFNQKDAERLVRPGAFYVR